MSKSTSFFLLALIPIVVLILMLFLDVRFYGEDSSYGSNQMALLCAGAVAGFIGIARGTSWRRIYDGIVESISSAMGAIIILLLIGSLAGSWLISGVIPAMIYYGLEILNPTIFLFAATIVCAIISVATGSSWGTVATVGVALIGIGTALGISEGWIAGAIISGAYFGDKMSPLSDTTNLAPAIAGTDLFTHIRHMVWTTGPSITIALIVFLIVGFTVDPSQASVPVDEMQNVILEKFNIGWHLFLVPTIVIVFIAKKMPAIPALFIGSILGCMFALIFQPQIIVELAGEGVSFGRAAYTVLINAMTISTEVVTSNNIVTDLLSTGGMNGMMNTIWLIICALTFGGIMQATGMLQRITGAILSMVKSVASLVTSTAVTCVLFNILAADQYLAIVVPGKMYADAYRDRDLAPENLSRVLEDAGTVTSVLIPWNTCGVAQATVLGVATGVFWPYCIFNLVSPLMTILFGVMGWKMTKLPEQIGSDGAIED